ncbi:MAG: YidC/Oxa1 family membrane protein insertase [Treponema sp.]|nr:YidC/Oxa1 family membrane protein insertase [Treponema sp.]
MISFLYTIFIFPIEQIIELAYVFCFRILKNPALASIGVSLTVSILTLPLYFMAEKIKQAEMDIQKKLVQETQKIKSVFRGDECFMYISAYYRQNHYHPLFSLRQSIPLVIQIPFFLAAYLFLANLESIRGVSFGVIKDLSKPDSLLSAYNYSINILPLFMTLISFLQTVFYSKGSPIKEKIQLYAMAMLFLVLLYNSPSIMVIYWTCNNLFSLAKIIIQKFKLPKQMPLAHLFMQKPEPAAESDHLKSGQRGPPSENNNSTAIFVISLIIIFLLTALVIPSSLIASSVEEFSFIGDYKSPFPFLFNVILQSFGIFIIWPFCIYFFLTENMRKTLAKIASSFAVISIVNVFLFPGNYGYLSLMFEFSEPVYSGRKAILLNLLIIIALFIIIYRFVFRFRKFTLPILSICTGVFLLAGTVNIIKIYKEFQIFLPQHEQNMSSSLQPVYQFSKNGENILIIMLDKAVNSYVPYIFDEKPELYDIFDGFTWYKNTISFGPKTIFGTPPLWGGYEYTPLEMQAKNEIKLKDKHNEALLLLPKIFLDHGFNVTVTDPSYSNYRYIPDLSPFKDYPLITAVNIIGKYTRLYLQNIRADIDAQITFETIKQTMIRFSIFKATPLLFRNLFYNNGAWRKVDSWKNTESTSIKIPLIPLNNYIALNLLVPLSEITDKSNNNLNLLTNEFTHNPYYLLPPEYTLSNNISYMGDGPYAKSMWYHGNIASFTYLGKWFQFLKNNGVYNNTRIIIVSDHGVDEYGQSPNNMILPDGKSLDRYEALLLVKDFDQHGKLQINNSFMTNADVPLIALNDIIENPVNPWTGKPIQSDKNNGITLTTSEVWQASKHLEYAFDIKSDEWLHVHTNIFDTANWSRELR